MGAAKKKLSDEQRLDRKRQLARDWARDRYAEDPDYREMVRAKSAAFKRSRLAEMSRDPNHRLHGTTTGYFSIGCHCPRCNLVGAIYCREYRRRIKEGLAPRRYAMTDRTAKRYASVAKLRRGDSTNAEIAIQSGYASGGSISRIAMRLGLPKRRPGRKAKR